MLSWEDDVWDSVVPSAVVCGVLDLWEVDSSLLVVNPAEETSWEVSSGVVSLDVVDTDCVVAGRLVSSCVVCDFVTWLVSTALVVSWLVSGIEVFSEVTTVVLDVVLASSVDSSCVDVCSEVLATLIVVTSSEVVSRPVVSWLVAP